MNKNRMPTNPGIDQQIFRNTALRTKAINIPRRVYRGGIRL